MSNPTSNFGWQMPTPTDLVTDLPADFEVFGQAVDSDFADLLGGTTGQVLSKTSDTDLDFTWVAANPGDITAVTAGVGISGGGTSGAVTVTNDMATTITASGDIVVGTGSGTYDNLPIGTTGQILTADTTVSPYKVKWATPASPSSGLTLIDEVSFSASSGINVNDVFSSTYNNYKIILNAKGDSFGLDCNAKLRVSGTNTSTNYLVQSLAVTTSTVAGGNNSSATQFQFAEIHSAYSIAQYDITAPFLTQQTSMIGSYGFSTNAMRLMYQAQTDATSFTGLALTFSANCTGVISIYGYAKE